MHIWLIWLLPAFWNRVAPKRLDGWNSQRFRPCRIDPNFHEGLTIEVIERGSAVHCVSAYEGDVVIMGSDPSFAFGALSALKILIFHLGQQKQYTFSSSHF